MENSLNALLVEGFGFQNPSYKKINGYDNENYIVTEAGISYIFKTYRYEKDLLAILKAENLILLELQQEASYQFPKPVPFLSQEFIKVITIKDNKLICRMLTFLEGIFLGDSNPDQETYQNLGTFLAKMDVRLSKLDSYILRARQWEWDLEHFHLNKKYTTAIPNAKNRNIVLYFFQLYEENVRPLLPNLRKQIIHNDANEWNILLTANQPSGLIDFGDLTYAPLINEVAIAMTYAAYDKENPLDWACLVLKGYHHINPIETQEIGVLYYLIAARLCTSVCNSAYAKQKDPDNDYASISEVHAWKMLHIWLRTHPLKAENAFRKTVGLSELPFTATSEAVNRRNKSISPILSLSYDQPIQMVGSAFQFMYDAEGNTFLDAYNNIPQVGHSHPKVVAAGQRQMAKLNTNTRYLYEGLADYAERLLSKFPPTLSKVFFVNCGSAASDLAIRMARTHTQRKKIMVMEHGYHGNTQSSIDISDYKFNNKNGQGQRDYIIKTALPDTYHGKYQGQDAGKRFAQDAITQFSSESAQIAAFISEPIVGCGGQVPLAKGYLKELYPAVRQQGGVCISDEVQTGFGRLGQYFWGFEKHDVVPDIVILGKPIANGHPMGAVVVTDDIAASFEKGVEFFSSFGGNPVSCAIASAVLDVIEEEGLQENAQEVGSYYKKRLRELQGRHTCIGDVRGDGLFIGIEIVHSGTKKTNRPLAQHLKNELRHRHILISTDGPDDSVLKTKPPLCFTKENVEEVVIALDEVLKGYRA